MIPFEWWSSQLSMLDELMGEGSAPHSRIEEIYEYAETKWDENLQRLADIPVRYLLIAEAPPWCASGTPRYFYGIGDSLAHRKKSVLLKALGKAFFPSERPEGDAMLDSLASEGFLLVDSLPFAADYKGQRRKPGYTGLVEACEGYVLSKLEHPALEWADEVKVALAFRVNGEAVIEAYHHTLTLPNGQDIALDDTLIATNAANYPDAAKLTKLFCLG